MTIKNKNNFDMQRQRSVRGKMGIPGQRYDDGSFNSVGHCNRTKLRKSSHKQPKNKKEVKKHE